MRAEFEQEKKRAVNVATRSLERDLGMYLLYHKETQNRSDGKTLKSCGKGAILSSNGPRRDWSILFLSKCSNMVITLIQNGKKWQN